MRDLSAERLRPLPRRGAVGAVHVGGRRASLARYAQIVLWAGVIAALAPLGAPAVAWPAQQRPAAPSDPAPVRADRDGDRVFDDLEQRVARSKADRRLPVIVTLSEPASRQRTDRLERDVAGMEVRRRFGLVDSFSAMLPAGQVRALARRRGVVQVEHDGRVHALNDGAQESFGVAAARAQDPRLDGDGDGSPGTYGAADLVAAVIDTGIDAGHADLDAGKVVAFRDFVGGRAAPYDDEGHGTHVAATIAGDGDGTLDARYRGVAPAAGLVGAKVLDATGEGSMSNLTAAIEWVVENRAAHGTEVINLSLGAAGCSDGTDATSQAVDAARTAGLVVVVAAGNEGPGTCTIGAPGAARGALTVGAMADVSQGGFQHAYFSSRGPTVDGRVKPDVTGPGVGITSAAAGTRNGYVTHDGTSMATPFVAGVALLALDAAPSLSPAQVVDLVRRTAIDWGRGGDNRTAGSTGPDIDYGAGRLDAHAVLAGAGAVLDTGPDVPDHRLFEGRLSASGGSSDHRIAVADTGKPIAVTLTMADVTAATSKNPNFDLYLLGPDGTQLASSTYDTRQDELTYPPAVGGTYTVRVVSRQGSGGYFVDASAGLTDVSAPETSITAGPSGTVGSPNASLEFSASEAGSSFECRLDDGAWTGCASPMAYSGLKDGGHRFEVRAIDAAGNVDATPAARTWTVDTTPPETSITVGPAGTVGSASASFQFSSSEGGSRFECRLDGAPWAECSSPHTVADLADGEHTLAARAIDSAANTDPTPAIRTWTVDTQAPQTSITTAPDTTTTSTGASFSFTATEPGSSFECRLDQGSWQPCSSPASYSGLGAGDHRFAVRATDSAGNVDATPAEYGWTVQASPTEPVGSSPSPAPAPAPAEQPATPTPAAEPPPSTPTPEGSSAFPAKLQIRRARVADGRLDVYAPISRRASGRVGVIFHAAGRRTRFSVPVDSVKGRVRFSRRLPRAQARLGTGIVTLDYPGNARTRAQTVRLRAASRRALLRPVRPQVRSGRLHASGTISLRARGVVRIQLSYVDAGVEQMLPLRARVRDGRWSVSAPVPPAARAGAHSYILFTGYLPRRVRGEMRSYAVG